MWYESLYKAGELKINNTSKGAVQGKDKEGGVVVMSEYKRN